MAEGEAPEAEEEPKKSKKKLIIMIVLIVVIGYFVATMTVLKPPPPTPAQVKAAAEAATEKLDTMCALANGLQPPKPAADTAAKPDPKTPPTTAAPPSLEGGVLVADSVTVNLADTHFLKLGLGFKLPMGVVVDTVKAENLGSAALNYVLTELRKKRQSDLGPADLEPLRQKLGYAICSSDGTPPNASMKYEGQILTIYFTDFVSQ